MRAKALSIFGLSILVMILLVSVASGAGVLTLSPLNVPTSVDDTAGSFTGIYNLTYNGTQASINVSFSGTASFGAVSIPTTSITQNESKNVTATFTLPSGNGGSTMSGTINATGSGSGTPSDTADYSVSITDTTTDNTDFCGVEFGDLESNVSNPGKLKMKIEDVNNLGEGEDDEWYPNDEIEIELEIQNNGDVDVDDISVEWGLWSEEEDEWVIEIDDEDKFNLGDDDDEVLTFTIDLYNDLDVKLKELKDGDYVLYVRAYGEVDNDTQDETCHYATEDVKILIEEDLVVLNDIKLTGTTFCGNMVQITADILNIGDDDQENVYIMIHNSELNINQRADVGDVDAFEDKKLDFEFTIPKDAEEKKYYLLLDVYDEDNDIYENDDDDESEYSIIVDVSGKCQVTSEAVVYASLESGGKAGEELKIKASVTNNGDDEGTFTISAADYSSWAELVSIEPAEVTLDSGDSEDVILTFTVNKDADENQNFNILLSNEDGESTSQPIAVTVEKGISLPSMIKDNGYLWGIALVNIILIIVIVLVAVKATRR